MGKSSRELVCPFQGIVTGKMMLGCPNIGDIKSDVWLNGI